MATNMLLSYSGSGNHLVRFFIELLTERPTLGWDYVKEDVPIYKATFAEPIPFNITPDAKPLYKKEHHPPSWKPEKLIVVARNPQEVMVRQAGINLNNFHNNMFINTSIVSQHVDLYFEIIQYYVDFKGEKLLLFYEDLLTDKVGFLKKLYDFMEIKKPEKLDYAIENVDKLYYMSKGGTNRIWLGPKSDGKTVFYAKKLYSTDFLDDTIAEYTNKPDLQFMAKKYSQQ